MLAVVGCIGEIACEGGFVDVFFDDLDAEPLRCALCYTCWVSLSANGLELLGAVSYWIHHSLTLLESAR